MKNAHNRVGGSMLFLTFSIVHKTDIPWEDKSGERLRDWLEVDKFRKIE